MRKEVKHEDERETSIEELWVRPAHLVDALDVWV